MQAVFERFLERFSESVDEVDFRSAMAEVASKPDLLAFAYLSLPPRLGDKPRLISNYPEQRAIFSIGTSGSIPLSRAPASADARFDGIRSQG